jgi:multidrug efflux pump subunit AcrB
LQNYNVEVSAGQFGGKPAVEGQRLNASIIVQNLLKTPKEFGAIPLRTNPGRLDHSRSATSAAPNLGTESTISSPITTANPAPAWPSGRRRAPTRLDTANAIKAKMAEMSRYFPHGMKVVYPYDTTPFIEVAIKKW